MILLDFWLHVLRGENGYASSLGHVSCLHLHLKEKMFPENKCQCYCCNQFNELNVCLILSKNICVNAGVFYSSDSKLLTAVEKDSNANKRKHVMNVLWFFMPAALFDKHQF